MYGRLWCYSAVFVLGGRHIRARARVRTFVFDGYKTAEALAAVRGANMEGGTRNCCDSFLMVSVSVWDSYEGPVYLRSLILNVLFCRLPIFTCLFRASMDTGFAQISRCVPAVLVRVMVELRG